MTHRDAGRGLHNLARPDVSREDHPMTGQQHVSACKRQGHLEIPAIVCFLLKTRSLNYCYANDEGIESGTPGPGFPGTWQCHRRPLLTGSHWRCGARGGPELTCACRTLSLPGSTPPQRHVARSAPPLATLRAATAAAARPAGAARQWPAPTRMNQLMGTKESPATARRRRRRSRERRRGGGRPAFRAFVNLPRYAP